MIHFIKKIFREPHPGYASFKIYFKSILGISVIVFLILSLYHPFGMDNRFVMGSPFLTALLYAAGSFTTTLINYMWIKVFPGYFKNENWNLGKEISSFFYQLVTIASTIWLINVIRGITSPTIIYYFAMLLRVTIIGLLPYITVLFIRHTYYLKRRLRKATMMNIDLFLDKESVDNSMSDHVEIDRFIEPVDVTNFVSAEAKDDYIVVNVGRNGNLKELIVGNTLSEFEAGNAHFDQLFKCNDNFIVNVNRILWIEGNAAGYKLSLHPDLPPIAVANDKKQEFKKFMDVVQ